jgi:hypothetical protein
MPRKTDASAAPPKIRPLVPIRVNYLGRERSGPHILPDGRRFVFHPGRPIVVDRESWPLLRELPAVAALLAERLILETP